MKKLLVLVAALGSVAAASVAHAGVTAVRPALVNPTPATQLAAYKSKKGGRTRGAGITISQMVAAQNASLTADANGMAGLRAGSLPTANTLDKLPTP